jgi:chromosome segregation ATPase
MALVIVLIVALIEVVVFVGLMYGSVAKRKHDVRKVVDNLRTQLEDRKQLVTKVQGIFSQMVGIEELKTKGREMRTLREALKTERGRITITQAELETVEGRLRELEEISRELEASGLETKEELNILKKKEKELTNKNDALKAQIATSMEQIDQLLSRLEMNASMLEQVETTKAQLIQSQEKIDTLMMGIEQGNEQYFILKKRYDALDIEYAQLFEKFSEAEALTAKAQGQ